MRKACLIVVALVSLVFAAENWIDYRAPSVSALPRNSEQGIPQVLPPAGGAFFPNTDSIKYDDNTASNAYAMYLAGGGMGVKFTKPANPVNLAGAMVNLWANTWPEPGGNRFSVRVYAANGPDGTPGDSLFFSDVINGTRGAWNYVPVGVPMIDYDFYIFYVQPDSYPMCPGMSIDAKSNAPDGTEWDLANGSFGPQTETGDWLIRAVLDWTPQSHNVAAMVFGNMPRETVPGVSMQLQGTFRNYGSSTEAAGIRVKMHITGPQGYVRDYLTDSTVAQMTYRGQQIVTFHPNWRTPDTAGLFNLKMWHELATDEYRANDTIYKSISVARWITYADWATPAFLTWANPERVTQFHPADFSLAYPVQVSRVKSEFYWHSSYPWDDSIFHYVIYGDDGYTPLWESDTFRAYHLATIQAQVTPPVELSSGDFYVGIVPRSVNGYPATLADGVTDGRSLYGSPSSGWSPWTSGEYMIAASAKTNLSGVEESPSANGRTSLSVVITPNPGRSQLVSWQIPNPAPVTVRLYDASGRLLRTIFSARNAQAVSGSFRIDTRSLAQGLYLLKLTSGNARATAKLIVN